MVAWRRHMARTLREPRYAGWLIKDKLRERRYRRDLRNRYFSHLDGGGEAPLPFAMNVFLTETCNLTCRFCEFAHRTTNRSLSFPQVSHILRQAADLGVREVNFTGGEPLTHPEYFRIQDLTRELGMRTLLSTNGILLERHAPQFKGWEGAIFVSISLDGARADTHDRLRGMPGAFDRTIAGITALTRVLDPDMIEMTFLVTRENAGELEDAYDLSRRLGVWFSLNPVQGAPDFYLTGASRAIYDQAIRRLRGKAYKIGANWEYYRHVSDYHARHKLRVRCAGLGLSFGVDVEGNLKPCCVWEHPYSAGNILETPLDALWHSEGARRIRQSLFEGKCPFSCYNITYLKEFTRITGKPFLVDGWER
ncbi:radical SAM protein [bacterium]|nr:radical SAM protein [candidate division CSSED10-310 bacterium]